MLSFGPSTIPLEDPDPIDNGIPIAYPLKRIKYTYQNTAIFVEIKQKIASSSRQGVTPRNDIIKHLPVIASEAKQPQGLGISPGIAD
jgi:hypothetical protein